MSSFRKCKACGAGGFIEGLIGEDGLCSDCRAGDSPVEAEPPEERSEDRSRELQEIRARNLERAWTSQEVETEAPEAPEPVPVFMFESPGLAHPSGVEDWQQWLSLPAVEQRRLLLCWAGFIATNPTRGIRDPAEMVSSIVSVCAELRAGILAAGPPVRQTEQDRPRRPRRDRKGKPPESPSFGKGFGK